MTYDWTSLLYENAECFSVLFMTSTTAIQPRQWRQDVAVGESPRSSVSHTSRSPDRGDRNPQKCFLPPLSGLWDLLNSLRGLTPTAISCRPSGADFCRLFSTKWRCPTKRSIADCEPSSRGILGTIVCHARIPLTTSPCTSVSR